MPAFFVQILVSLAFRFGVPFILKRFPGIPPEVLEIIEDFIKKLTDHKAQKQALVSEAKTKVKQVCEGAACPVDTKGLG